MPEPMANSLQPHNSAVTPAASANLPRAVVAFAGARDYFQVPLALAEGAVLEALVTDLYWPRDQRWFEATLGRLMPTNWQKKRYCEGLNSRNVRLSWLALAAFGWLKISNGHQLEPFKGQSLGRLAASLAARHNSALLCYNTYAAAAFGTPMHRFAQRFLFQMHPHPASARRILLEEMELTPWARTSLAMEYELRLSSREYEDLVNEPQLANGWLAASSYTAQTLSEHGVPRERVQVVPYGVDTSAYPLRTTRPDPARPFTIIWVGSAIQRKGLAYLLEAISLLKTRQVRLVICTRQISDPALIAHYPDVNIEYRVNLPREALVAELHQADVFALPSLIEGFAHVIVEAMACGLPIIATPHTCAPDIIQDGREGFIVPIRDAQALAEKITWGMAQRVALAEMGQLAGERAREYTWPRFRSGVRAAYAQMVALATN